MEFLLYAVYPSVFISIITTEVVPTLVTVSNDSHCGVVSLLTTSTVNLKRFSLIKQLQKEDNSRKTFNLKFLLLVVVCKLKHPLGTMESLYACMFKVY